MRLWRRFTRSLVARLWAERRARRKAENFAEQLAIENNDLRSRMVLAHAENVAAGRLEKYLRHELDKARLPNSVPKNL